MPCFEAHCRRLMHAEDEIARVPVNVADLGYSFGLLMVVCPLLLTGCSCCCAVLIISSP